MPKTQSVAATAPDTTTEAYRPRTLLRYKRTDTFDESLRLEGTFVKATLTFDEAPDPVVMTRLHRHLSHALKADLGMDDNFCSMNEAEVTVGRGHHSKQNDRIDIFSDRLTLGDIRMALNMALHRYHSRDGFQMPKVTADQHKQMVEHGIKLRKDGLFGYHLLCARDACTEHVSTCYTQADLHTAIWDKEERRSRFSCSTYCWLKETDPLEIDPDLLYNDDDLSHDLHPFIVFEQSEAEHGETFGSVAGLDLDRLRDENPDLLKRLGDHLSEMCEPMDDTGSSSCET